ncbi:hypothetical protein FALBO_7109 [Fusarium albosuccineum]|uniref:CHAT domain-containing protein n=1 Tax=Fusarium albosuccineum TaxID=1237068 RepID=A0A8H4PJV2_9HYPO|nr:hypothetical protein FALBO_7109 [Fusarium albosuccineum]
MMPVTKVNICVITSLEPKDGHRRWRVKIKETAGNEERPAREIDLKDPFSIKEYEDYETRIKRNFQPSKKSLSKNSGPNAPTDNNRGFLPSTSSSSNLQTYKRNLHRLLRLDKLRKRGGIVKISIGEDLDPADRNNAAFHSIHGLLWEILEEYNERGIIVTRWITGIGNHSLPAGLRSVTQPIRLLLIVSRSLQQRGNGSFHDVQSVVYDTLYALVKLLRDHNRHDRLSIDMVRPGTLAKLEEYLENGKKYDMVHIDTHGFVEEDGTPQILFAKPDYFPASKSEEQLLNSTTFDYTPASDVAALLKRYNITVAVFSSCQSAYTQRKSLSSSMCHVFAKHGICAITGMNFSVLSKTAEAYYAGFYSSLVLHGRTFRSAAIHGRDKLWEQKGRRLSGDKHETWPTVATYFAAHSLDKTDSIPRLGDHRFASDEGLCPSATPRNRCLLTLLVVVLGFGAFRLPISTMKAVLGMALALFIAYTLWPWASSEVLPLTDFMAFKEGMENQGLKHSVGLMAFEDRLKCLNKLFIQIDEMPPDWKKEEKRLLALRDQWLTTNSADVVQIVPASDFQPSWLRLPKFRRSCVSAKGSRVVLIITELEDIIKRNKPLNMNAINQMNTYIREMEHRHRSNLYLIFMSHESIGWQDIKLDREDYSWLGAQPFRSLPGFITFKKMAKV